MSLLRRMFSDPGAIAVAYVFAFLLMGSSIWLPWLVNLAEALP